MIFHHSELFSYIYIYLAFHTDLYNELAVLGVSFFNLINRSLVSIYAFRLMKLSNEVDPQE